MIFNKSIYNTHWNTKELNELGIFSRGKSKHRPRNDSKLFENGKYPLIQTGDIKNAILYINSHTQNYNEFGLEQSKLWDKGTLCITIAANIADTAILSYPMCFPDSVVGFSAYTKETSEIFMHYIFIYIQKAIQNSVIGSIQDNINIDYLKKLRFKIPPKEYQDKIVSILSSIDKKIELNNKINSELEAMAKTIYDYWFLQFEFPNEEGKPYKSSGGKMVWNNELKREIPEGWEIRKVKDFLEVITGKEDANHATIKGIYPFFTCSNDVLRCDDYKFEGKAILIAGNGDFNIKYYEGKFNAYQRTYVLIPNKEENIGVIYLSSLKTLQKFKAGANGSIVKFITKSDVENINVYDSKNQIDISIFNKILDDIIKNRKENQELISLRDFLLPLLMNGQVGFKE